MHDPLARLFKRCLGLVPKRCDPNQPRVPAGSPGGGQWIDGGAGDAFVTTDESGERPWSRVVTRRDDDGRVSEQTAFNRDGSRIHAVYGADSETHTVTTPEG